MARKLYNPEQGELVDVTWVDITEESTGSPETITPEVMVHSWRFHSWRTITTNSGHKVRCGLFTSSKTGKDGAYYHAIVLPKAVILEMKKAV
jgi:hypothetical protein